MAQRKTGKRGAEWGLAALAVLLLLALIFWYCDRSKHPNKQEFLSEDRVTVHFIDVGQGASTLIQSGKTGILIDAGEYEYADTVIGYLHRCGIQSLSLVIATHPHSDHIGAMSEVLAVVPTDAVVMPRLSAENTPTSVSYERLLQTIRDEQIPLHAAKPGAVYSLPNATLELLAPLAQNANLNNMSVVCRLTAFETVFLLTGDAETAEQETIVRTGATLRCDVLQVPHHGSDGALYAPFWTAAQPQTAVISCGRNNDYGHPHRTVLRWLKKAKADIYRTDKQGDIIVGCYANGYRIDTAA